MDDRSDQERSADVIAGALRATAGELARQTPQVPVTAQPPEVVDAVRLLHLLARRAEGWPDLCYRAMCGKVEAGEWALLANVFRGAAQAFERISGDDPLDEDPVILVDRNTGPPMRMRASELAESDEPPIGD